MTSFLFVVKIPISEDDKSSSSSDKKSDSDNDSDPKKDESDDEGGQVSKDADKDGDDRDTETSNSGNQKNKSEKEDEEGWDFGEGEPEKGADLTKSGVENDGVVINTVTENNTQPETQANGTCVNNQVQTQTTNVIQTNETQGLENTENSNSKSQSIVYPAKTTRTNADTGKCNDNNNITKGEEESVKTAVSTEGSDVYNVEVGISSENREASQSPPKKTFIVEKADENSLPAGTKVGSDVVSLDDVEMGIVRENRETSKSPQKKTFTVEKANENSLPLSGVSEKQKQIEGIVEHLEKSQSVPPGKLHDELPMPKSLSDDRIAEIEKAEGQMVRFIEDEPLIEVVKRVVESFSIDNFSVQETENREFYQVIFLDEGGERCESILNQLAKEKIGDRPGTSVSIFPSSIYRGNIPKESEMDTEDEGEENDDRDEETPFKKSIKARMLVTQVFNNVRDNAQFTFDYLVLCVVASVLACLGLVENSSVILVASMLVSPLMGPILGGTFGTVMHNKSLRNLGIKNELIGLLICLISGLLFGFVSGSVDIKGANWGSTDSWPTDEMKSRGVPRGLWVGVFIALPSGIGVALSVLGGNSGSLIGVAISASLLPPAVNAGMLWAYSIIAAISPPDLDVIYKNVTVGNTSFLEETFTPTKSLGCKPFINNKYSPVHSCDMATEALYLGLISLSLTLLNILCIFIMGITFLKIKEVAPQHTTTDSTRDFWSQDIQVVKESYSTSKGPQSMQLAAQARKLLEDWKQKRGDTAETTLKLQEIIEEVENSPEYNQFLPRIGGGRLYSRYLKKDFEDALHQVQEGYIPETRVVEEKTKSGYNVYRTFHGLQPTVRRRTKPRVTFDVDEETPAKHVPRPMSDGSNSKSHASKRFSIPLNLRSKLYTRRKSKESKNEAELTRFEVSKVDEEPEDFSPSSDARNPMLDANV